MAPIDARRRSILVAGGAVLLAPSLVLGQSSEPRTARLGVLFAGTRASSETYFRAFFEALVLLGWTEGRNLYVERRFAEGRIDRLDAMAAQLVAARVDVVYAPPTPAALAARRVSSTVPIVFSMSPDPVGAGLVRNLGQPGGNATGLSTLGEGVVPKRIQLILELVPRAQRIGLLYDSREPATRSTVAAAVRVAKAAALAPIEVDAQSRQRLADAFVVLKDKRAQAVLVFEGSLGFANADLVVSLAAANRLPALYAYGELPAHGGLMSYSVDMVEQFRRARARAHDSAVAPPARRLGHRVIGARSQASHPGTGPRARAHTA